MIEQRRHRLTGKRMLLKILGWPSLLRRVQWWSLKLFYLERDITVLDFGCGSAEISKQILSINPTARIVATDLDTSSIEIASDRIVKMDVSDFWQTNAKYDIILLSSVLQMVSDPADLLKKLEPYLSLNGEIHLTTPDRYFFFGNENNKPKYSKHFGVKGRGYISQDDIEKLLKNTELSLIAYKPIMDIATCLVWETYIRFFTFIDYKALILFLPVSKLVFSIFGVSGKSSEYLYRLKRK
jgi:SAM-dependent methyltransferase